MRFPLLRFPVITTAVCASFFACGLVFASASLDVAQKSDISSIGKWALVKPDQTSVTSSGSSYNVMGLDEGHYTMIVTPPYGTTTNIVLWSGSTLAGSGAQSQMSFNLNANESAKIQLIYTLVNVGKVGVSSNPSGMMFDLQDPNGSIIHGVTPASYDVMPIGTYSVRYLPQGCNPPPAKSSVLQKYGRVDFSITVQCSTFVPSAPGASSSSLSSSSASSVSSTPPSPAVHSSSSSSVASSSSSISPVSVGGFSDVQADAWYATYVQTAAGRGILTGYKDASGNSTGQFGPSNPVTLGELLKIAHVAAKVSEAGASIPHNLSARSEWYTQFAASAENQGWSVYLDPAINLNRPATRSEVVATLVQAFDISQSWPKGNMFKDVNANTPYAGAIETSAAAGIVEGTKDAAGTLTGLFNPGAWITRAEMAKIIVGMQDKYPR